MIKYIDYDESYHDDLSALQTNQWGANSDSDEVIENIKDYIVKLAVDDNKLIGTLIFHKKNEKCLYLDMIVIKPDYQKMGIGTTFMQYAIDYAKNNHFKMIESEAIEANGHTNSKKLLENFGFVLTRSVKNFWGELCPDFECKECGNKPCTCTMHEYIKTI